MNTGQMFDVTLVSTWTEPVYVNPGYQLVRNEINHYAAKMSSERIGSFLSRFPENSAAYGGMVRYQEQYPFCPGLLSIAGHLKAHGVTVRCVSLDLERDKHGGFQWLADVAQEIARSTKYCIGVSAVTPEFPRAVQFLEEIKRSAPSLLTVVGGTHVTYEADSAIKEVAIDIVVRGEGEETLLDIVSRRIKCLDIDEVAGTTVFRDGRAVNNPSRPLMDLSKLCRPAYECFSDDDYKKIHVTPTFTRGCPYSCAYCVESIFWNRRVRHRDPIDFAKELKYIAEVIGWRFIHIADSTFGLNREVTRLLCDAIEAEKIDALFSVNVRPEVFQYLGEDLVRRLVSLGFVEFYFGMESTSESVLSALNRKQSNDILLSALSKMKDIGVPFVKLYLVIGLPGDNHSNIQSTIQMVRELIDQDLIYYATAKFFVPTPGTPLFSSPNPSEYEIVSDDWSRFERYNFPPVIEHAALSVYELEAYLILLQGVQLSSYRKKCGVDREERSRIGVWVEKHYHRKMYL